MKQIVIRAIFSGSVQGVGFRYSARQYATELGLVGTVQNLPDSSVELIAEGTQEDVDALIDRLKSYFKDSIRTVDILPLPASKSHTNFRIL